MLRTILVSTLLAAVLATGPAFAGARANSETIPPNCTLDPFTGKMN